MSVSVLSPYETSLYLVNILTEWGTTSSGKWRLLNNHCCAFFKPLGVKTPIRFVRDKKWRVILLLFIADDITQSRSMFVLWKAAYDLSIVSINLRDESWSGIGVMNIYTILILELDLYVDGVLWSLMLIESTSKWGRGPLPLMTDCLCGQQTFKSGLLALCLLLLLSFGLAMIVHN